MYIEIEAYTNIAEVYVDVFEFQTTEGELLAIESDSTYYDRDEKYCRITDESEYEGLYGVITQICDGDDKDTDNDTPDIYCSFEKPEDKKKVVEIELRFSKAYGEEKKIDELALDMVIMAPSMIRVLGKGEAR